MRGQPRRLHRRRGLGSCPFDHLTDFALDAIDRIPDEATRWLRGDCWDAVMNYLFTRVCYAFFIGDNVDVGEMARTSFRAIDTTRR